MLPMFHKGEQKTKQENCKQLLFSSPLTQRNFKYIFRIYPLCNRAVQLQNPNAAPNLELVARGPNYLSKSELVMQHPLFINHCPTKTNPGSRDDKAGGKKRKKQVLKVNVHSCQRLTRKKKG